MGKWLLYNSCNVTNQDQQRRSLQGVVNIMVSVSILVKAPAYLARACALLYHRKHKKIITCYHSLRCEIGSGNNLGFSSVTTLLQEIPSLNDDFIHCRKKLLCYFYYQLIESYTVIKGKIRNFINKVRLLRSSFIRYSKENQLNETNIFRKITIVSTSFVVLWSCIEHLVKVFLMRRHNLCSEQNFGFRGDT